MEKSEKLKRLFYGVCILGIILGSVYLWATSQAGLPYRIKHVDDIKLHVPQLYLSDEADDLIGMMRDYVGSVEGRQQLSAYADEILTTTPLDQQTKNSRIILTLEKNNQPTSEDGTLIDDQDFFAGAGEYSSRTVSAEPEAGLYIFRRKGADQDSYSTSRLSASATIPDNLTMTHCITFKSVNVDGPSARCSMQLVHDGILVTAHFNKSLAWHAGTLRNRLTTLLTEWQQTPKAP